VTVMLLYMLLYLLLLLYMKLLPLLLLLLLVLLVLVELLVLVLLLMLLLVETSICRVVGIADVVVEDLGLAVDVVCGLLVVVEVEALLETGLLLVV